MKSFHYKQNSFKLKNQNAKNVYSSSVPLKYSAPFFEFNGSQVLLFRDCESVYSSLSVDNHTILSTFRNLIGQCTQNLARPLHPSRQNMT